MSTNEILLLISSTVNIGTLLAMIRGVAYIVSMRKDVDYMRLELDRMYRTVNALQRKNEYGND